MHNNLTINWIPYVKPDFKKQAYTVDQHLALLESRGLSVKKKDRAKEYLTHISYYRLSWYTRYFYKDSNHNFKDNVDFSNIIDLYSFDRRLKIQLLDMLERIEISFKTRMINHLSELYGSHWFLDEIHFASSWAFWNTKKIIDSELEKNKDNVFIKHYSSKYQSPEYPPSWMLFQLFSFWGVGNIYKSLSRTNKNQISKLYGLNFYVLESWIDCMSYLRNLCAHSDRVWNRRMTKKVNIKGFKSFFQKKDDGAYVIDSLYSYLLIIWFFLKKISPQSTSFDIFKKNLIQEIHLKKIVISNMGFPTDWEDDIWKILLSIAKTDSKWRKK